MKRTSIVLMALALATTAFSQMRISTSIDLTALDFYARAGFKEEWTYQIPAAGSPDWVLIPKNQGNRSIIMRNTGIVTPPPLPLQLFRQKPENFTLVTQFEASSALTFTGGLGIYMAEIGQNWEIYLNGNLVRSEIYLDYEGFIKQERSLRGALVAIDARFLKIGQNTLTLRILGDPSDSRTGLFLGAPYVIEDYERLIRRNAEYIDLMLIGIYFFFALYHILLFILRPKNLAYLYFGLASIALSVYLLFRTKIIFEVFPNSFPVRIIELASLFIVIPAFVVFFDQTIKQRVSKFTLGYLAFCVLFALAIPFVHADSFLKIWQFSLVFPLGWLLASDLALPMSKDFKKFLAERDLKKPGRLPHAINRMLTGTDSGKLLAGILVICGTIIFDIYAANAGISVSVSKYGFLILMFGSAGILANQFVDVYNEIEELNVNLEQKVDDRTFELHKAMEEQHELNEEMSKTNLKLQYSMDIAAKDMKMATTVQTGLFPKHAPATDAWDIAYHFLPASGVSGDFYDFYLTGSTLNGMAIGDVSGHGIASGLITVLAKSILYRNFKAHQDNSLGFILEASNKELIQELTQVDNYLTCIMLRFSGGTVEYVNAAHTEILFKKAGQHRATLLKPKEPQDYKGPPLGREGIDAPYRGMKFKMNSGDVIILYTDCLNEARNADGEEFGIDGIGDSLNLAPDSSAKEILDYILSEFRIHVGTAKLSDDLTAVVIRKK